MKTTVTKLLYMFALLFMFQVPMSYAEDSDTVYGWEMMSQQERMEHQEKMRNMKTDAEREQYQMEHHEKMMQRAKENGVELPDMDQQMDRNRDRDRSRDSGGD